MASISSPLSYLNRREYGMLSDIKSSLFTNRLNAAKNLYRKDLVCHFGCVNAIEFSKNGELLVSGGDDRRVMLWQFGKAIMDHGNPETMKSAHQSNIFCLGITSDSQKIYSGGNDDLVIVHDVESCTALEALQHQRAVCCLSVDPFNDRVLATAGNDGRLLLFDTRRSVHETMTIARSRKAFHGVMYHPNQNGLLVSANAKDGVALMDLRSTKTPLLRYNGINGTSQNSMSVRFNSTGRHVLALRRRQSPVLYAVQEPDPVAEFYHQDYYNSCTMKSCSFAGDHDQYVLSGSDDFNLYTWKIPTLPDKGMLKHQYMVVDSPHIVLYGHRSIVNQVRYNPHYNLIASSGVEKIIKVWSGIEYPQMRGALLEEAHGSENPREIYTHEDYVSLVHHSGQYISHNYAEQSTTEDPRMMAFFDSLVQRELECLAEETDSLDGSNSAASPQTRGSDSDSSDNTHLPPDQNVRWSLPPKRQMKRLARVVAAARYTKNYRTQTRGSVRRSKQTRANPNNPSTSKCVTGSSTKGKRTPARRTRGPRRVAPRAAAVPALGRAHAHAHVMLSAPSSERTDSDEPAHYMMRNSSRMIRPLRRRMNPTRVVNKRKNKSPNLKRVRRHTAGIPVAEDFYDSAMYLFATGQDNTFVPQPSTSTGFRNHNPDALFRIAEADSDDEQSGGSRPHSPLSNFIMPSDFVSVVATPANGSQDSHQIEPPVLEAKPSPPTERRPRLRKNGRLCQLRSDSSGSPTPKPSSERAGTSTERVPQPGYYISVAELMNETNESEMESSCSTEGSIRPVPGTIATPDNASVVTGTRNNQSAHEVSDEPECQAVKFRQRIKKARRNFRNHVDSDSN